ncbi:hypothetical protein HPP92_014586 [Vanilla planifolia]|uniref:RNA uridylyltransferase n=1 Tax=Vanilla planifolia TaxID=51239 RepID=A0A835QHM4_VANPL|nr:hypothetical protein HPP92_014586 [Vanilla planifolia]
MRSMAGGGGGSSPLQRAWVRFGEAVVILPLRRGRSVEPRRFFPSPASSEEASGHSLLFFALFAGTTSILCGSGRCCHRARLLLSSAWLAVPSSAFAAGWVHFGEPLPFSDTPVSAPPGFCPPTWSTSGFSPPADKRQFFAVGHQQSLGFLPNGITRSLNSSNLHYVSPGLQQDGGLASSKMKNPAEKKVAGYRDHEKRNALRPPPGFGHSGWSVSAELKNKVEESSRNEIGSTVPTQHQRSSSRPDWKQTHNEERSASSNTSQRSSWHDARNERMNGKHREGRLLENETRLNVWPNGYRVYKEKHTHSTCTGVHILNNCNAIGVEDNGELDEEDHGMNEQNIDIEEDLNNIKIGKSYSDRASCNELPSYQFTASRFDNTQNREATSGIRTLRSKGARSDTLRGHRVSSQLDEIVKQEQLLFSLRNLVTKEWPNAELHLYGSCANSFGVSNSDIDVCLAINNSELSKLDILLRLADILKSGNLQNVQALPHARVPIVKLMDPVTGISCDICINNLLAVINTKLLKDYAQVDKRLRQLAFIVKHWAKCRQVNETYQGTLSSYAYVLMCIHFLQSRKPAILPCLQGMKVTYKAVVDDIEYSYYDQVEKLHNFGAHNKESIAQLLWAFFHYWAYKHDYTKDVISVRIAGTISKHAKDWTRRIGNDRHLICIEDPFEVTHDLGRVVDKFSIKILREEFERAADILQYDPNPTVTLFEPYVQASTIA